MLHRVARQRRVVGLDVQLEIVQQIEFAQEIQARRRVGIVLMLGRFFRLGLDVELAFEADLLFVIHGQVQEFGQMLLFAFHVRVEQRRVAFAPAPERVAFAAEFVRDFHRLLHLRGGKGENVGVAARARAVNEARIGKQVRRAPEQFDAGAFLFLLQNLGDGVEVLVRLGKCLAFRRDIAVVECVKRRA